MNETKIQEMKARAYKQITAQLDGLQCQYKIITPDGVEYGELHATVEPPREKRTRKQVHKSGEIRDYLAPYLAGLQPGQSVFIPVTELTNGPLTISQLQSSASAHLLALFGKGNTMTSREKDLSTGDFTGLTALRLA